MIIKKRSKPLTLKKFEALQARLPQHAPQHRKLRNEVTRTIRGYEGELTVDGYLKTLASQFTIIQDLTLETKGQPFQMDNLLITPQAIYLIEVKNFSRPIHFDSNLNQFSSGDGKFTTGYRHPITQVKMHKMKLENWLAENNQPNIPIRYFVAISNPQTTIHVSGNSEEISNTVLHGEHLPWKILELESQVTTDNHPYLHQKIGYQLLKHEISFDRNILREYNVEPKQLLPGVRCEACNSLEMKRRGKSWRCSNCGSLDKHAGIKSVEDYMILVKPRFTNKECQQFLGLNSRHAVKRILNRTPGLKFSETLYCWERVGKNN
jgi:ribosomal protein L37AE/L43A